MIKQTFNALTNEVITDMKKSPTYGWIFIGLVWLIITAMIVMAQPTRATWPNNEAIIEDYITDIDQLHFGDLLKAQIYSLDTKWEIYDIDKLAHAIAIAETGDCTKGVGPAHNNPVGIRRNGRFEKYNSCEEGLEDFKRVWSKNYGRFPTLSDAKRWTGNDSPITWLNNVTNSYEKMFNL